MIDKCEYDGDNGAIVCLDQEKAYNKISHDFLWATLEQFNFPAHLINTFKVLYKHASTHVLINRELSSPFTINHGVRQGDSPSCYLFDLAIESLAQLLCNSDLHGLNIPGLPECLITTLFADDTTVFLSAADSYNALLTILAQWCHISGTQFNIPKTTLIPTGTAEYRALVIQSRKLNPTHSTIPLNIHITLDGEPTHTLGAFVGNNLNQTTIWAPTVEKIDATLKQWNKSHLTLDGHCLITNMVIGGHTQYLTKVQGMPHDVELLLTKHIHLL